MACSNFTTDDSGKVVIEDNNNFIELVDFDDGHYPGSTDVKTKLAVYHRKYSTKFLSVFDDLLSSEWCDMAYRYAIQKGKPWGMEIVDDNTLNDTGGWVMIIVSSWFWEHYT